MIFLMKYSKSLILLKGCDSNFEVNKKIKFKSCYKWNIYLALNKMHNIVLRSAWYIF